MTPSTIVVYAGKGTKTANETAYSISAEIDHNTHSVIFASAADIRKGTILKDAALLAMPGGADRHYCEELDGQGTDNIAAFARRKALIAICASAFFSCDGIEYHAGLPDEVISPRLLKLFPGTAYSIDHTYGHIYDEKARSIFAPQIKLKDGKALDIYCHGGCAFRPNPGQEFGLIGSELMAEVRYEALPGKPVAIARVNYPENGIAILSGVHFEMPSAVVAGHLRSHGRLFDPVITALEKAEKSRRVLTRSILRQCGVMIRHNPLPIEPLISFLQLPALQPIPLAL